MTLNDKVQTGDSTTGTSTSTTTSQWQTYRAEQGWECPRCGRINAPWVRQCDCSSNHWTITTTDGWTYKPTWWKEVTCNSDTFKVHPDSTVYPRGNDYKVEDTYVNVGGTQSNKVDPNITAWSCTQPDIAINDFTTYRTDVPKTYTTGTIVNDGIHNFYNLKTSKETK